MISKILFLTETREDYLADSLLHGLISLGLEVVDFPCKQVLYESSQECPVSPQLGLRGHGFSLYGLLPDRLVNRSFIYQRLELGWFDLVIVGQIWRQWGQLLDLAPLLQHVPVVLLDGDDDIRLFHRSTTRLRRYGWQPFPIHSHRCYYLKREWQGDKEQDRYCRVYPASFSIPEIKIRFADLATKKQRIATHCVDSEVAKACALHTSYAFTSEQAYYDDISQSRFAVTTKRGGWDCLRHYEIAAAGAVPCVRHLDSKPLTCAPHGLIPGVNCISYKHWHDLQHKMNILDANPDHYQDILKASGDWVRNHTTTAAAKRLIELVQQ